LNFIDKKFRENQSLDEIIELGVTIKT